METAKNLQSILSPTEIKAYEILLDAGPSYLNELVSTSQMKRSTLADALKTLSEKNLVEIEQKTRPLYKPLSPDHLEVLVRQEQEKVNFLAETMGDYLALLKNKFNLHAYKPKVKFYEGAEGIKEIHRQILSEKQEILAYVLVDKKTDKPLEEFWGWYYKQRKKHSIKVRSISLDNEEGKSYQSRDKEELRITRLIPQAKFPLTIEKNICANKVAFLSLKPAEMLGVIVESKAIADSERSMFELAWEASAKYNTPA